MSSRVRRETGKILLVDGSEAFGRYLARRLQRRRYRVDVMADGPRGLAYLLGHDIDVVLYDRDVPRLKGLEACRLIKKYPQTLGVGVILLDRSDSPAMRVESLRAGADDVVGKSASLDELDGRIQALLRLQRLREDVDAERRQLSTVLESLSDAVLLVGDDGFIQRANRAAQQLLCIDPDIIRIRSFADIFQTLGIPPAKIEVLLAGNLEDELEVEIELEGEAKALRLRTQRVRELGRTLPLTAVVLRDVTEHKEHEILKADFHSMIAHDLRNPITVAEGYVQLLLEGKAGSINARQAEFLEAVRSKMVDMTRLLDDFLDVSKLDAGFVNLNLQPMDTTQWIEEGVEDVAFLARDKDIALSIDLDPQLSAATFLADPHRLKQVLQNLLTNAIKYNREGGWVRVCARALGDALRVEVRDNGLGLDPEEQRVVFERYARARTTGIGIKGIGLGLRIVRKIVEAHGGEVGLSSAPGEGSTFWFSVPRHSARRRAQPTPPQTVEVE